MATVLAHFRLQANPNYARNKLIMPKNSKNTSPWTYEGNISKLAFEKKIFGIFDFFWRTTTTTTTTTIPSAKFISRFLLTLEDD